MCDQLEWLNWLWQFLCMGLFSFNPKGFCYWYAWSCSLCELRTSFCKGFIFRKLCRFLFMFLNCFSSFTFLLLFSLLITSFALRTIYDAISSNIDEALLINSSGNVFIFGDFGIHHKDWLNYYDGTDWLGELCYDFSISNEHC